MTNASQPYPPLAVIEARLFGESVAVDPQENAESDMPACEAASLPNWLKDRIDHIATQRSVAWPAEASPGQIWSLAYAGQHAGQHLSGRIPILLDMCRDDGSWQGWIVSHDTDYAGLEDVILDAAENPISPLTTMVQTWNVVQAQWDSCAPYLGHIQPAQLELVRSVFRIPPPQYAPQGQPCQPAWREISPGVLALTGQSLGAANDPRWAYRRLYREFAVACLPETPNEHEFDV
jgi:hypothetical protein